ncbi:MAG: Na+/H+ antiporter subunit E [Anaerolineae bacterium]|nr:Na+/H+ antiporter subunit E [Anaerolineae bacterium]
MLRRLAYAIPMALAWMLLTSMPTLEGFGVGLVLSIAVLTLLFSNEPSPIPTWRDLPSRVAAAVVYFVILLRDIFLAAIDVAKRVIDPAMPLNPGIIATATQFEPTTPEEEAVADTIAAISAHGITITPGELVVDFDGNKTMYVHCLDVVASSNVAESNQAKRLKLLRKILL